MRKLIGVLALFLALIGIAQGGKTVSAAQAPSAIIGSEQQLNGQIVPMISNVPNTGQLTLHFAATSVGATAGDVTYLSIKLPEQFKAVASDADFKNHITGLIEQNGIGGSHAKIDADNTHTVEDRIVVRVPNTFWIGVGRLTADINVDYGAFLLDHPQQTIEDSEDGYQFIGQLKYNNKEWDVDHDEIIADGENVFTSPEKQAVID